MGDIGGNKTKLGKEYLDFLIEVLSDKGKLDSGTYLEIVNTSIDFLNKSYELGAKDRIECPYVLYRFKSRVDKAIGDIEGLGMPYWVVGEVDEDGYGKYYRMVCYLPKEEELGKYFSLPFDVSKEYVGSIEYNEVFSKPDYLK